jgi:hypothetical protein
MQYQLEASVLMDRSCIYYSINRFDCRPESFVGAWGRKEGG